MIVLWQLVAKFLLSKALSSPNAESPDLADVTGEHPERKTGGAGIAQAAGALIGGIGGIGGAGAEAAGAAGGGSAMDQLGGIGGNSPLVGSSSNMLERFESAPPELQGQLAEKGNPSLLRAGMSAVAGYHNGGLGGVVEGWRGSMDQQQGEHEKQVMRRFYGDKARRAGGI